MPMTILYNILIIAGVIFAALVITVIIIARLYRRSSKEISFVRTGFGGGAIVLPVLHEIIPVNMNILRLGRICKNAARA